VHPVLELAYEGLAGDAATTRATPDRIVCDGKHLRRGDASYRVKGVTYGSFTPRSDGALFPESDLIRRDLAAIADAGLNTIRTYSLPPADLWDAAEEHGIAVLVGLHYDDWRMTGGPTRAASRATRDAGLRAVEQALHTCAGRQNLLAISVGNEVPADLVRLHGATTVEKTLGELAETVHRGDPDCLVTYTNFPSTEYLQVPGIDLTTFNVFLEDRNALRRYLRHLQVVSGSRPLVVTELGLASEVHGRAVQAASLEAQLCVVDETGCAGATVFSWTDEWGVDAFPVEGWGFGLTTANRIPKPALQVVRRWAHREIHDLRSDWPALSIAVCAYNEERRLPECLDALSRLDYPRLQVIVCDDGSTDETRKVAERYPFTVLALPHGGLSNARNAAMEVATGDIIAYLDADAYCHPEWPYHIALSMEDAGVVGTGGPNLPVENASRVEQAVASAPGSPVEVLLTSDRAEHVPGCNMAYRLADLRAIGGFDSTYVSAGDDVDVCWRLLDRGGQIAFSAAAQVRHHRRDTIRGYFRQQRGYGRSERMLQPKHRHRFNRLGQARWGGAIYGGLQMLPAWLRPVVYYGAMGSAPFQPMIRRRGIGLLGWLPALLPLAAPVTVLCLVLTLFSPWFLVVPGMVAGITVAYGMAAAIAARPPRADPRPLRWKALVGLLHVAQPFVRTWGRALAPRAMPPPSAQPTWSCDRLDWLRNLERELQLRQCRTRPAGAHNNWDLVVVAGPIFRARITTAVRWRWHPEARVRYGMRTGTAVICVLLLGAAWTVSAVTAVAAAAVVVGFGVIDVLRLRRRIRDGLTTSTAGARIESWD
jgi:glycosyltransferase involved in cell wall biosynthesis